MQDFDLRVLKALAVGLESAEAIAVAMGSHPQTTEDALAGLARYGLAWPVGIQDGHYVITQTGRDIAATG